MASLITFEEFLTLSMVVYLSESEVLERLVEGLKKSASRAEEFTTAIEKEKPQLFLDFMNGIKTAAGSAHALAHSQMNPQWLTVRDLLEKILDTYQELPVKFANEQNIIWIQIKDFLLALIDKVRKLAERKALQFSEVLKRLDARKELINLQTNQKALETLSPRAN